MKYADPRLVDHLASAYVLGTLTGGARRRFERLQRDRVDVQLAVAQWEYRLGQLAGPVRALRPSPRVWQAIAQRTHIQALARQFSPAWRPCITITKLEETSDADNPRPAAAAYRRAQGDLPR